MKTRLLIRLSLGFILSYPALSQLNTDALPWKLNTAYQSYLLRLVHREYADREHEIAKALSSRAAMKSYQDRCRKNFLDVLGDLTRRKTPLHPQIIRTIAKDGFRVENIIFESLPGRHVTANLYIPTGKGPFPAALVLCGHFAEGKAAYQQMGILFALNGIAALVVDPVSQGERLQLTDDTGHPLVARATTEHTILNAGSILAGTTVAAIMAWDNTRALDYLESRPDIDRRRIGCMGSSGGGTQTTFLMALDSRIQVAAISSFMTRRDRQLEVFGPDDGCQYLPMEGQAHLELADYGVLFAPKPLLLMASTFDFVDYWGTRQSFAELEKVYTLLHMPGRVGIFSVEGGHGLPRAERERAAAWFRRWLCDDPTPVSEWKEIVFPEEDLRCTATGQVLTSFTDEVPVQKRNLLTAQSYADDRKTFLRSGDGQIRKSVLGMLGDPDLKNAIRVEKTGTGMVGKHFHGKYQIIRNGEVPVPCLLLKPERPPENRGAILVLDDRGKDKTAYNTPLIDSLLRQCDALYLADLRGIGETFDTTDARETKFWYREYSKAMIALHAGRPLIGQRVTDIFSLVDFITSDSLVTNRSLTIIANGDYGPPVIHAVYLDSRISSANVSGSITSYEELIRQPLLKYSYGNLIPGVLKYYDLTDLAALCGTGRIVFK